MFWSHPKPCDSMTTGPSPRPVTTTLFRARTSTRTSSHGLGRRTRWLLTMRATPGIGWDEPEEAGVRIEDWFLTAAERGNPAYTLPDWSTGNAVVAARARRRRTSPDWWTRCPRSMRATTSSSPTGAATPTSGWAPRARRSGRCSATRPSAAWSSRAWSGAATTTSCPTARSRTATSATTSARRAGRCCSTSASAAPGRTTRRLVVVRTPASGGPTWRSPAASTCATRRRDDAAHHGDPQTAADGEGVRRAPALARRPAGAARAGRRAARRRVPRALDGPALARHRQPDLLPQGPAPPRRPHPGPAAGAAPGPAGPGPCAVQVLRTYPAIRPKTPYAPRGERSVARGYGKALPAGAAADVPRGPVHVVPAHRAAAGRRAAEQPRAAHHRRRAAPPRRRRPLRAAARTRWAGWRRSQVVQKVAPDRVHVFDLENARRHPDLRARQGLRRSTTCGRARAARTSTGARGATTASCRARCWTTTPDEREPRDPAGLGDGARRFARDLRLTLMREHLDRADGDDDDLLDPDDAVRAVTAAADALDAWHDAGRVGPRPPGRLRPHRPEKLPLWTRLWAVPAYRLVYDPDGRSVTRPPAPSLVSGAGRGAVGRATAVTAPPDPPPAAHPPSRRPR